VAFDGVNVPVQPVKDKIFRDTSPLVRRFADQIIVAASGKPIVDVACGSGRNALFLARLGGAVICIDKDLSSFNANPWLLDGFVTPSAPRLQARTIDLRNDHWPFASRSVGGIINVHFLLPLLFPLFADSLTPCGYLLLETVAGHGENYRELPQEGELKTALADAFDLVFYNERPVGPSEYHAVAVQLVGKRKV
jgi:SAM-dependent methyltransferase